MRSSNLNILASHHVQEAAMDYAGPGDGKQGRAGDTDPTKVILSLWKGISTRGHRLVQRPEKHLSGTARAKQSGRGKGKSQAGWHCMPVIQASSWSSKSWCGHLMTNDLFSLYQVTLARIIFSSSIPSPHTVSVTETPTF